LSDEPIYENVREGLRFNVPKGWLQQMKTDLPPGPVPKERTLVLYRVFEPSPANFEVSVRDIEKDEEIAPFLARKEMAGAKWTPRSENTPWPVPEWAVGSYRLQAKVKEILTYRDVLAARRGSRIYFFNVIYWPKHPARRDEGREAMKSVKWLK
jgi:hypothetical protein